MKNSPSARHRRGHRVLGVRVFVRRLLSMTSKPVFIALTIVGNTVIGSSALAIYFLEKDHNPHIHSLLDTIWWAVATVTTVGYGDISPVTNAGKIVGIVTMVVGTALFWSYTALFAEALISDDIIDVESELRAAKRLLEKLSAVDINGAPESGLLLRDLEAQAGALRTKLEPPPGTQTTEPASSAPSSQADPTSS